MKRFILMVLLALTTLVVAAQTDYPVVERNGKQYYEYRIQKGDGLYAIGRKFGVTQASLFDANPGLTEAIREGDILYIPTKITRAQQRKQAHTIHVVESGETPFVIAKRYQVPLDTLLRNNPQIRNGLIRVGDTLIVSYEKELVATKVATRQDTEQTSVLPEFVTIKPKETLYSISKQYNIAIHDILDLNPGLESTGLKAGMQLRLKPAAKTATSQPSATPAAQPAVEQPVAEPATTQPVAEKSASPTAFKIAYILPLTNSKGADRTFVEFYRGSLVALERLKDEKRISDDVEVWCWDTRGERTVLDSILLLDELKQVSVVIGPGNTSELAPVLTWCRTNRKKLIVPFSSKIEQEYHFSQLYQFNPPQEWWWKKSFNYELTSLKEKTHFIIGRCGNDSRGTAYANTIKNIMELRGTSFTDINVTPENIDSILRAEARTSTILLLANSNGTEVRPIIDKVAEAHLWNVTIWGFSKWGQATLSRYDKINYGSLFYDRSDQKYNDLYHRLFKIQAVSSMVRYDLLGYDITMYALNKDLFLQSELNFEMINGRWLNTTIYKLGN